MLDVDETADRGEGILGIESLSLRNFGGGIDAGAGCLGGGDRSGTEVGKRL